MARIRTLNFLPEIFQTPTNAEFLAATLDQVVSNPVTAKVQGYVGSRFGPGINALDYYVTEPTKVRTDYQLEPGVVFTKPGESIAQDFITYPGIVDSLNINGAVTDNNDRLFQSQFYSWDSFTSLDKLVNYHEYYWIPDGPPAVTVSNSVVFTNEDYIVTDLANSYKITEVGSNIDTGSNPTLTLLRGGVYNFTVNQDSQFWIQTEPGVDGVELTHPNIPTREVYGVSNNGASDGVVTFNVPPKNAQDQFIFPGNNIVDVVSTLPFSEVNGQRLYTITDPSTGLTYPGLQEIDGVSGLDGLRVLFYNTGTPDEIGYISSYYDETFYDVNDPFFTTPATIVVDTTDSANDTLTVAAGYSTASLITNQTITFSGTTLGGLVAGQVYFVKDILNATDFTVSESIEGATVTVFSQTGIDMTVNINQGQFEQGFYSTVNQNFYRVQLVGDPNNPVIRLLPDGTIPNNQNITPSFGVQWINRPFYRSDLGIITLVPQITAPNDTLYYQDGVNPNKVGVIKIVENNGKDYLDIDTEILGKINYTSPNGVTFTNGLKVQFDGNIFPVSYRRGEYYVEGVGTSIELISVEDLVTTEDFTIGEYVPWDVLGFDIGNYDINLYLPVEADYITIARNSINRNAWSRSNRWFHIDVINATATYNDNSSILTEFATQENKAKRPIIEFYPNLKLFNSGSVGKQTVDFFDTKETDALTNVAGLYNYYPDVETYTTNTAVVTPTPTTVVAVSAMLAGESYEIQTAFGTTQAVWNTLAGTEGVVYIDGDIIICQVDGSTIAVPGTGSARLLYDQTTIVVPLDEVTGIFQIGMYTGDTLNVIPVNSQIINLSDDGTDLTLTINWPYPQDLAGGTTSIVGTDTTASNYAVFPGARIIFANDSDSETSTTVYLVDIVELAPNQEPQIVLTRAEDATVQVDEQVAISRGYTYQGKTFYYNGIEWLEAQQKLTVNQAPLFDVFDDNGISYGNPEIYNSTTFKGCSLFSYGINPLTVDDPILGFPVRFSDIGNIGDISFDVTLNADTFDYVRGFDSITQKVNTGYVHNFTDRTQYQRELGWQTAVAPSTQYQVFNFSYQIENPTLIYTCDIQVLPELAQGEQGWPRVQVYYNNVYQEPSNYTVTIYENATSITLINPPEATTVVQVLLLSDQVSNSAYYMTPLNLNNNPFNEDLTVADLGDIRNQYQDIFVNAPNTTGNIFGINNFRDLGNLVPYGTKIIQNSASLAIPGAFLRKSNHNLFNALMFTGREYVKYKQLLVDTVQNTDYTQRYTPSDILDDAIEQISASRSETNAFFWSDMLPNKSPFRVNTYTFKSNNDVTRYPLSKVYNFESANYDGVLVYLNRIVNNNLVQKQLLKNVDYTISADSPTVTVTLDLVPNDTITVKEYNQTYGSYVPYTPSKLGLYALHQPQVVLDSDYTTPTYFIKGHDGSYTKLYGDYIPEADVLVDFRDQALLEFEKRIYNNIKLSTEVPIKIYDVVPGFFRDSDYSYDEWLQMYSVNFLNWIGENRLDYKTQFYNRNNEYTYNYTNAQNKLDGSPINQGYWRGLYEYLYDTTTPNLTPWEMLGFSDKPAWWESRYGPAPYTSDNLVLWTDVEEGIVYSADGTSIVVPELARPGITAIIPVDSAGNLLSPLYSVVGSYNPSTFQKDWKVGDDSPVELSYRRSSTYPFDVIRLFALTRPAEFFNLAVDLDNYKYNAEFNQYLVNNRTHLIPNNIEVYGNGIAKTSYINWIVDYEKQIGIDATSNITSLLDNLDVRLIYRLAGYSDKTLLKFYVEKGSPNSANAALLIPDESYSVLLYDNQPFDKVVFTSIIIQQDVDGYKVFGNSQDNAYFTTYLPINNGNYENITVVNQAVKVNKDHSTQEVLVPYGTKFYSAQEVAQFIMSYSAYLNSKGMIFDKIESGAEINWNLMVQEFLYWTQTGWEVGSIITLNPAATDLNINRDGYIVQPLTLQQQNFILNQDLYPIQINDLCVNRDGTSFRVHTLNEGDAMSYAQLNISNFEHGIVFDNTTLFNDVVYNLVTGLRQNRITLRGTKTAEWNGTVDTWGFILNQDNVQEWARDIKYPKGIIVKYKNKYWTALTLVEPSMTFRELDWQLVDYQDIQKGLLPNAATRAYESTLYYNCNDANLEQDSDLLSFSLIGYRPRDYLALADLTDITQINVYKNMIKNKGTRNATKAFDGINLPQGGIQYDIYENWAIKSGDYGGVLNENFVEFRLDQNLLTGNPSIVSLNDGVYTPGAMQEVSLYNLFNYGDVVTDPNILSTLNTEATDIIYPSAGYANFDDVKMSSFYYAGLPNAVDKSGKIIPIRDFYVRDYFWLANFKEKWGIYTWNPIGQVISAIGNVNGTTTVRFAQPHNLKKLDPIAIVNFSTNVDGYYLVSEVVNLNEVIINLNIPNLNNGNILQGLGIGLLVTNQRVSKPSDIESLALLEAEFTKNTVWVDENTDGGWAVYRKNINYQNQGEITVDNSTSFGSSVAYTDTVGYLVGDPGAGIVHRFYYDEAENDYALAQVITESSSFGSAIAHAGNTFVISQPTGTPKVFVYIWNDTTATNNLIEYQEIAAPGGVTNWGSKVAISGDQNWIYISDHLNTNVYVYRKASIELSAGYFASGQTYTITSVGTTDFTAIGAVESKVGITFVATGVGTGTGTATQVTYQEAAIIDGSALGLTGTDGFGKSISTDYYGDCVFIGSPNKDHASGTTDNGEAYFYQRSIQNFETQFTTVPYLPHTFNLAWTPDTVSANVTATNGTTDKITVSTTSGMSVNDAIVFVGAGLAGTGIEENTTYYIASITGSDITVKTSRTTITVYEITTVATVTGAVASAQTTPLYVTVNGTLVDDSNYAVNNSTLIYTGFLRVGDIVNVSGNEFYMVQEFNPSTTDRINIQFGYALDTTQTSSELLIGSPFEINEEIKEGKVYRYTNAGAKFGVVIGTEACNVLGNRTILINGFAVSLAAGNAEAVASVINATAISNVIASSTADNKLIIQVVDQALAQINSKLVVIAFDDTTLAELGMQAYSFTQLITCPHPEGPTEFGKSIKFNEADSVVIGAPVGPNFVGTTFDFTDDENLDNDTVFDNNATRFVESYPNSGAVYMFDLLSNYEGSVLNPGAFVYAQSVNTSTLNFDANPYYGYSVDFSDNNVVVGAPNMQGTLITGGQATGFNNATGVRDWSEYRQSAPIVDIEKIQNTQIFSAISNNTLVNLDYMDPLQGKLLGSVRQNIDYVSGNDPAKYNSNPITNGYVWGAEQVGQIWFSTRTVRFVNYHQNDVVYNSEYWGTLFPGSDVAVYTWVGSNNLPSQYSGPGVPFDVTQYCIGSTLNSSNIVTPVYYFWVRNANIIDKKRGKTLSDSNIASYIARPKNSGVAYVAPLLPNTFALYNSEQYFESNDSIFHLGYGTGTGSDVAHTEYALIRENYPDDFLPGLPSTADSPATLPFRVLYPAAGEDEPNSLYARLLDSLSGCNLEGAVVPDPFLPAAVQSGVLSRPRQSFFYDRFAALKNYLTYANEVLIQYPIVELKPNLSFTFAQNEFMDTYNYWNYVNWWLPGYNDSTRAALQVPIYADLAELRVAPGTIVKVEQNGQGFFEFYRYDDNGVWTRIGLENGTFQINSYLWDYAAAKLGYGGDFFDTTPFDVYPSEETRNIIRALNEQIYTGELLVHRNRSLVLLFEYIQSETIESENYLSWLNKTSLMDVFHTVRELKPYRVFKSDNVAFLEGYINEVKPYHVVIKEFLIKYTGSEEFTGDLTDFDVPATYNTAYQEYISPQLVYSDPNNRYESAYGDSIWSTAPYNQWYQNFGLSITGETNYMITTLKSFLDLGTRTMLVDNASGFPTNGVVRIGQETIAYTYVDRDLNLLGGLTRGFDETVAEQHIPGEQIYIDLPAVVVLNEGNGYTDVPQVTAYIDTSIYPEPRQAAVLQAVMSGDRVSAITVIDPGEGYAVLPEIRIASAYDVFFSDDDINPILHTINLYAPSFETGDLVKFTQGTNGAKPTKLVNDQWYYVGVLESLPTVIVALYNNYSDAVKDQNRIEIAPDIISTDMALSPSAKASIITSSQPTRENNITLRFDRTTYDSQVIDWESGTYYGSFFAGNYDSGTTLASSSVLLESTEPDINQILASADGVPLQISNVENDRQLTWSSFIRSVERTDSSNNSINLTPNTATFVCTSSIASTTMTVSSISSGTVTIGSYVYGLGIDPDTQIISQLSGTTGGTGTYEVSISQTSSSTTTTGYEINASGTTIGFYVNMPVKFTGSVVGGLVENQTYYVSEILNSIQFSVSTTENGSTLPLSSSAVNTQGLSCYVGEVVDTAILTLEYPGILQVTETQSVLNTLTVPMTAVGTGGTTGFATNLPVFFTGNVFGGIIENLTYYITTVVDNQTFTLSEFRDPVSTTVSETVASSDTVVVETTSGFNLNDPVIFTALTGTLGSSNIEVGRTYYVREIVSGTEMILSQTINGSAFALANGTGTATVTNQKDTVQLTSGTGSMTINVALPVSPGQINGQLFTLYQSSGQYPNIVSEDYSVLIERSISATVGTNYTLPINRIAISEAEDGTNNFYVNMPIQVDSSLGGLSTGVTYYVIEYSGMEDTLNPGEFLPNIQVDVSTTSSVGNILTCSYDIVNDFPGTASLYVGMPIVFSGVGLGSIVIGRTYYIKTIVSSTEFTVSETPGGATKVLTTANGVMLGTGDAYIKVSTSKGGSTVSLTNDSTGSANFTQFITQAPEFDLSYVLGGYNALITNAGEGFALDNVISIPGTAVDGTTPANDITLIVNSIDVDGGITSVIRQGTPPSTSQQYYLQVRSANTVAVYSNPLLTVPVSGIDFPFVGFTESTVTGSTTDTLTVDTTGFNEYDAVSFSGEIPSAFSIGETYYLYNITPTTAQVTTTPNDAGTIVSGITFIGNFTMAKIGSIVFLPEPFYFNQSVVKFNNRVYECIISNNDDEFIFGKWQLLNSGDRRLNAMDRVIGYYQPTADMPGVDLTQLFEGVTYPNSTYLGNAFEPDQQYPIDTILTEPPFLPSEVDSTGIAYDGAKYITSANLPSYSAILGSTDSENWNIGKLTNNNVNLTDIEYAGGIYLMTSANPAAPVYRSDDGIVWTTTGYYTPDEASTALSVPSVSLNAVAYCTQGQAWVAVGQSIVRSEDSYLWEEVIAFDPTLAYQLNDVSSVTGLNCSGLVAVGKGKAPEYSTGLTQLVDINLFYYSADSVNWTQSTPITDKGFYGVASDGTTVISVGESGVIYYTQTGIDWVGLNEVGCVFVNSSTNVLSVTNTVGFSDGVSGTPVRFNNSFSTITAGTTYYIKSIVSSTQVTLSNTLNGSTKTITSDSIPTGTRMYVYDALDPNPATLRSIIYANGVWIAVGENGVIKTSPDGIAWAVSSSGVTNTLDSITYNDSSNVFTVVGDNNTILVSDDLGVTWTATPVIIPTETVYDVTGADFSFGYAPEELVAGEITDNIAMVVTTRPGTNWPVVEYGHSGFEVVSLEIEPTSAIQVEYSFVDAVKVPAHVNVQVINGDTGLGTSLPSADYTIDWVNKSLTLNDPISFSPRMDMLRIDVYAVGNGDQLVKSSTDTNPIRTNTVTGFNEIYLDANYSATISSGSGVVQPGGLTVTVRVFETDDTTDRISCDSVAGFVLNNPITFQGVPFGVLQEDTVYYVKTISYATNTITVSLVYDSIAGTAGPTLQLTNATGEMFANIQTGATSVWSDPVVDHNGEKLVFGTTGVVTRSKASNNAFTTGTTSGMIVDTPITFEQTEFGVIVPFQRYYIKTIIDGNEFTISETQGGPVLTLTDFTGLVTYVTNDYAIGQRNGNKSKLIFATDQYSATSDYIVFSLFGETDIAQYGYALPEVQYFTGDGTTASFYIDNFVGYDNPDNAIVEIDGIRQTLSQYTISSISNTILFTSPPAAGEIITVMTYNDTNRQYLNSQYNITGSTVAPIANIVNTISLPLASTYASVTTAGSPNEITVNDTTGFVADQTVQFFGTSFDANIETDGTVYYVDTVDSATTFTIKDYLGTQITTAGGTGNMLVVVGGNPTTRISTSIEHNLVENTLIRLDGTSGSVQLNNNVYYAKIINPFVFDIYDQPYSSSLTAVNDPVTTVSSYTGGGYAWRQGSFFTATTTATATTASTDTITVGSTESLVEGTPVYFSQLETQNGTTLTGGLVQGTVYYVKDIINATTVTVSATRYGEPVALTDDTGTINVTQWAQADVDRLWVTLNGYRVPSSKLKVNDFNEVSILTEIVSTDQVIITSMIPSSTPNEDIYINFVNTLQQGSVYRVNPNITTWLTQDVYPLSETIYVDDVRKIARQVVQEETTPAVSGGFYYIGLDADKNLIAGVSIFNNSTGMMISQSAFSVEIIDLTPTLKITPGAYITAGNFLTITTLEGNTIFVNGEQIRFGSVDFTQNSITQLTRGSNGTASQPYIEKYSSVYGLLSVNKLPDIYYNETWNSKVYNTVEGDPLQISETVSAIFLNNQNT
jgi:hypothetical protein